MAFRVSLIATTPMTQKCLISCQQRDFVVLAQPASYLVCLSLYILPSTVTKAKHRKPGAWDAGAWLDHPSPQAYVVNRHDLLIPKS